MKTLACRNVHAVYVEEAIQEFNNRIDELGIQSEKDVVSVSVLPVVIPVKMHDPEKGSVDARYEVVFVYWTTQPA